MLRYFILKVRFWHVAYSCKSKYQLQSAQRSALSQYYNGSHNERWKIQIMSIKKSLACLILIKSLDGRRTDVGQEVLDRFAGSFQTCLARLLE